MWDSANGVPAQEIDKVWEDVAPLIAKAIEYSDGKYTLEFVRHAIISRAMQLWVLDGGVWVTEIVTYPNSRRAHIVFAAGHYEDWERRGHMVKAWARANGCEAIEFTGRKGWGRKVGAEEIHRTFRIWL